MPIYHRKFELADEIEVFKLSHFLRFIQIRSVFQEQNEDILTEILSHTGCMANSEYIKVKSLTLGLESYGYKDFEFPRSRKYLDFSSLTLKSVRVLNRLISVKIIGNMQKSISSKKKQILLTAETSKDLFEELVRESIEIVFNSVIRQAKVKIAGKDQVDVIGVIESRSFFEVLYSIGIRKNKDSIEDL